MYMYLFIYIYNEQPPSLVMSQQRQLRWLTFSASQPCLDPASPVPSHEAKGGWFLRILRVKL